MEKRVKRIEIVVALILIIVLVNLFKSDISDLFNSKEQVDETIATKDLPADLTKKQLNKIAYKIKTDFNQSEWFKLYDIFGEFAKAQLDKEDVESSFIKLKSATGNIQTYAYSHYIFEGDGEDAEWFEIHYKCRFENGKGTIKISTRTVDETTEVTGVNITLDEL